MQRKKQPSLFILVMLIFMLMSVVEPVMAQDAEPVVACELFSAEDAEIIFGASVEKPPKATDQLDEQSGFWSSMCNYYAPEPGISMSIMIRPVVGRSSDPREEYAGYLAEMQVAIPGYSMQDVEGLGEAAGYDKEMRQLIVFTKTHVLHVTGGDFKKDSTENLELAKKMAKEVLERL